MNTQIQRQAANIKMMKRRIHIENLRIKLPASMRSQAHSMARAIGNDVARGIGTAASGKSGKIAIDDLSIGSVRNTSAVGMEAAKSMNVLLNKRSGK